MKQMQGLIYHTFFAEFRGVTPAEVIQSIYEDSAKGTGHSYPEWWAYQKRLWGSPFSRFPHENQPDGCEQLLKILVKAGALAVGPKSPAVTHKFPGVTYG